MITAQCPACGTQTSAGAACHACGTPVPADTATGSGYGAYWASMKGRLEQATSPKYRVTGILGYGGMAGVFAAEEPRLGRRVAIKVMSPALMMDPKLVERFVQEARTIAHLSHPNIVTIYEVEEANDLHWFAMTYVGGRTLGQVMADALEPLAIEVVRAWLYQIGDALSYAHQNGVVHRDVKPGNVLLDVRGNALVTDFGIAKVADNEAGLTRTGMLVGTPTYMSPEQCSSGSVGGASDQYSLGAVAYQMLTRQPPFSGPTLAVLQAHVMHHPTPIRALRPECPEELASAVERMLSKRSEDRFPTLSAAISAAGATPPGMEGPLRDRLAGLAAPTGAVTVSPVPARLREGSREQVQVTVSDASDRPTPDRRVIWTSSMPTVAQVRDGELQAYSPGVARLVGTSGPAAAMIDLLVEPDPVRDLEILPPQLSLDAGSRRTLTAAVYDLDGSRLENRAVLWTTSDATIARVSASGVVEGLAAGEAMIAARSGGKYAAATITVTPAVPTAAPTGTAPAGSLPGLSVATPPPATGTPAPTPTPTPTGALQTPSVGSGTSVQPPADALARRKRLMIGIAAALVLVTAAAAVTRPWTREAAGPVAGPENVQPADPSAATVEQDPGPETGPATGDVATTPDPSPDAPGTGGPAAATETVPPPVQTPGQQAQQPPQPAFPQEGTLAVLGELPAGSSVTARDADGRNWNLGSTPTLLPPGRYTLQFRAPGYEPDDQAVVVQSRIAESWAPRIRTIEAPPVAPAPAPVADTRADLAAIDAAVRAFVAAFDRRDGATVVPLLPADVRANWAALLDERGVTDFSAALADIEPARISGDSATVSFVVNIAFRNNNQNVRPVLRFTGSATRTGSGWRMVSLTSN